jgi:hypothetical protein
MSDADLQPGTPVLVHLHSPREKVFGLLVSLGVAGVVVRGLDLQAFDDWLRQEVRGEPPGLGPLTLFYPMSRVERVERDESVGGIEGFADRYRREVGRDLLAAAGLSRKGTIRKRSPFSPIEWR